MQKIKILFLALVLVGTFGVASVPDAFGAHTCTRADSSTYPGQHSPVDNSPIPCPVTTGTGLISTLNRVFNTLLTLMLVTASFVMLWAAFIYITSEGQEEKVQKAKNMIVYAVVALVIAALAWGAPTFIQNFITGI